MLTHWTVFSRYVALDSYLLTLSIFLHKQGFNCVHEGGALVGYVTVAVSIGFLLRSCEVEGGALLATSP